jgi:hypothetical protein
MNQEGKYLDAFGKALYDTIFLIADNIKYLKACVGICFATHHLKVLYVG